MFSRVIVTVFVLVAVPWPVAGAAERHSVLLIVVDDLNDWVGCMGGHPQTRTPNIDKLAAGSVLFTNAHCQAPVCTASRASFMTGRLPSTTGIYALGGFNFRSSPALQYSITLPEAFADAGYDTVGCGKIFDSGEIFATTGRRPGLGPMPKKKFHWPAGHRVWDWGPYPQRDDQLPDFQTADFAIKQLGQTRAKPLFLAVGLIRPHVPMCVPQKWFDMLPQESAIKLPPVIAADRDDLPDWGQRLTYAKVGPRHEWMTAQKQQRAAVRSYLACVAFADAQVGRILDALEASGRRDRTIVVLTSDHGFTLGEKERWGKRSLWERSTRVPLIVSVPGGPRGEICTEPVGLIDLYPTLADLCGIEPDTELEGTTLRAQLTNPKAPRDRPTLTTFWTNNHAVRSRRYRYIRYSDGSQELYDHTTDPNEWKNLAMEQAFAPVIAEHRRWLPKTNAPPIPGTVALDVHPDDQDAFDAL